ncbi:MAG: GntR family transcriptional regulator, partial [Porcincola intestinalis]|uniref:GntR family transcriptional regulator n=1 Tax=Porcincola intestinalis TaxID=2606632 RepID=UPI002A911BF0
MMQNTGNSCRKNLKYQELYGALCGQIPDLLKKGTAFFTQLQIQERYGVSRQTVLRALRQMEADGLIVSRRGSGTTLTGLLPETEKNQVVLLLSSDSSYTYPSLINDVSSALRAARYSISICASHGSLREEREILTRLCADPPRGLLLECCHSALPTPNADLIGILSARKTAIAVIGGVCPNLTGLVSVREDDRDAGQALCRYFLRCGHRQLGGIFLSDTSRGQERYFGFVCALKEAGYLPLPEDILWLTGDIFTDI